MTERSLYNCSAYVRAYVGLRWSYNTHSTVCDSGVLPCAACVCTVWGIKISIWFFVPLRCISRRESSGYTFATTGQMYD